jgi:hypothetical protein
LGEVAENAEEEQKAGHEEVVGQ